MRRRLRRGWHNHNCTLVFFHRHYIYNAASDRMATITARRNTRLKLEPQHCINRIPIHTFLSLLMRSPFVGSFRCAANASNSSTLIAGGKGGQNRACFYMVDTVRHFGGASSPGSVEYIRWLHDDSIMKWMRETVLATSIIMMLKRYTTRRRIDRSERSWSRFRWQATRPVYTRGQMNQLAYLGGACVLLVF